RLVRFRPVVERHLPRYARRRRRAYRRDLARAEAGRALSGHDVADAQRELRPGPAYCAGYLCCRRRRRTRPSTLLLRRAGAGVAVLRLRASEPDPDATAKARVV